MIYFDHNATTPLDGRVLQEMLPFLTAFYGNPSTLYKMGRLAQSALDCAREQIAALAGAKPEQVIFTSGGTEANALALHSLQPNRQLIISAIEHPSILESAHTLQQQGHTLTLLPVTTQGALDLQAIEHLPINPNALVSVMLANNETGCIQDIARLVDKVRDAGAIFHTDAVQALGKIPLNFAALGVHRMSISSHKIYGPKGCGALIVDDIEKVKPILIGGGQEKGQRAGTENVAAIVGFGKAAELALQELTQRHQHLLKLRLFLEQELMSIPNVTLFAQTCLRLPNTVQFAIQGTDGEMLVMQLDQKDIAISSGSACASGGKQPSSVLTAMGIEPALAKGAVRVSLGMQNTANEIIQFISALREIISI